MKKLFTLLAAAFSVSALSAQITITKSDVPVAGDSFQYMTVQPIGAGVNVNNTGANTIWNFTNLTKNDSTMVRYYRSSQTPYGFYFLNTMGQKIADDLGFGQFSFKDVYSFYKATNSAFTAEGTGFKFNNIPLAGFYTEEDHIYRFPLTYGKTDSGDFRVVVQIPGLGKYSQSGTRKNYVDGWGKITLPNGNPLDCIRLKSVLTQTDSISVTQPFPVSFGFPSSRVEYKWLTKTDKVPVLELSGTELMGNFTPTSVRYRSQSKTGGGGGNVSVSEVQENKVRIYPNPASDRLVISLPDYGITHVKLFTMEAKEINIQFNRGTAGIELDVANIPVGSYMVFANSGNEIVWEKITINR